jgi:hypothetical protein
LGQPQAPNPGGEQERGRWMSWGRAVVGDALDRMTMTRLMR